MFSANLSALAGCLVLLGSSFRDQEGAKSRNLMETLDSVQFSSIASLSPEQSFVLCVTCVRVHAYKAREGSINIDTRDTHVTHVTHSHSAVAHPGAGASSQQDHRLLSVSARQAQVNSDGDRRRQTAAGTVMSPRHQGSCLYDNWDNIYQQDIKTTVCMTAGTVMSHDIKQLYVRQLG